MSKLSDDIKERLVQLEMHKAWANQELRTNASEGTLRISKSGKTSGNTTRYYQRTAEGEIKFRYIPQDEKATAMALAQKAYCSRVLEQLCKEEKMLREIDRYYDACKKESGRPDFMVGPEELTVLQYREERRMLIKPIVQGDEAFIQEWMQEEYRKKEFREGSPEYYTAEGIRVRSKTEWIIAEMLTKNNIPFHYEKPLILSDGTKIHPDFTLLRIRDRKTLYWEHLGMMDDPGYCERALEKVNKCILSGIVPGQDLIVTYETAAHPVRPRVLETVISRYFPDS